MDDYAWLIGDAPFDLPYQKNYSFTRSAIGCGGVAALAVFPQSVEQLLWVVERLNGVGKPYRVLGKTTNCLPFSGRSETVFVFTSGVQDTNFCTTWFFGAGVSSARLMTICKTRRLTGAESLWGIPCSIGGAAYMNAGVVGGYFSEIAEAVLVYGDGEIKRLSVSECGYAYKRSRFMDSGETVLGAFLRLTPASEQEIEKKTSFFRERRKGLPRGKSLGCIFKNPPNVSAGSLIEGAGLKGLRFGGAIVSTVHANFIINDKNATVAEIKTLITTVKNAVFAQYGVRLEEEIRYLT